MSSRSPVESAELLQRQAIIEVRTAGLCHGDVGCLDRTITGVSQATLHRWRDQAVIDAGLKEGTKSIEVDELAQARQTIAELAAELAAVKAAIALFNGEEP